jgi:NCS1 family nucleobase:cation symporter-1
LAFALVIGGLWTAFISQFGIGGFVNTLGATLAPLYGILIVDYYLVRKQELNRDDLYNMEVGDYHYGNGWNDKALIAFGIAAVFSVATVWVPALGVLSGYAWVIGAVLGGVIFKALSKDA